MANEWDVVSEEPARPARVASGPQASAAADPWAVVGEAPEGVIHDLPPVRAETSAVGQQILGAFSEIMGGAQPALPTPVAQISVPQDFRAPIETAAMRDRRRAATMAGSVFAEAPPERTAGELASDLYDRGRVGVRGVASGLVDLVNVPQYAVNTLNASAEGWARMLGADLNIPTLPAYDWTRGTQAELAREQDAIRAGMSPAAIRQAAEFGATDGVVAPLSYLLANPGEAAGFAIEQAPQFLTAGLPGGVGAKLAGAGLMAGGQTGAQVAAENQRRVARGEITQSEADRLTAQAAISSGVVNSMLQRIVPGGTAIEEAMAGARQAGLSRARGAALGGLGEGLSGFGEEAVDQIAQNEGTGRPALEGALKAGTLGAIMEGGIGSLAGAYSAGGRTPAQPESREQRQPPAADAPRTNAIAPEILAAGNEALRAPADAMAGAPAPAKQQAAPPRRRAAAEAGAVIDDRLQALRDAAGRRLPDEERSALAAEAADLEALVREQDALTASGVMGSPETRLTAAERAQADQRRAEIRAALEADRAAAEYGRQLQTLERQLGNIDTDAGLIDLAERIAGTPVDTGGKPAVQRAPQQPAANATGENRVQDQEDRHQAEGRAQAEGQGQAQEVVAAEGGSGVSATPAVVPASSLEGGGGNVSATGEGAAGGEQSRLDLIDAWRAATTADERAAAAQRIAEHDVRAANRGRAGGEARAGDGARREAGDAGAVPADVRGAGEQAPASRQVRDASAGRVADRYQDTDDAAIRATLGSAARGITVHRSIAELHPDDRDRLGVRESDDDIEGLYDPDTGRVHIFEANLDTAGMPAAARRAWVAAHERSGHAGLRGMFADAGKSLTATLRRARQNPTIDAMVRAMEGGERPERGDILVEEAIVELGAALRTGDFGHIRDRYGVDVSPAQRSTVRDFIGRIVSAVREALGKPAASMSDADVWRLIEDANRYAKRGEVRGTSSRARGPVASRARRVVAATTGAGKFQLTDEVAPAGTDFSEFGEVRQVIARDGDKQIGKLVYANDGTPPTIEVAPEYRRRGVATAMLKLAREQGGVLGDARSGMRRDGGRPGYRTDAGQAFREGADESRVTLVASRASRLLKNLTPAEQKKVTDRVAAKIEEQLKSLPSKREMAAIAHAGRAKRGWYRQSAETILSVFGADAPRFAGLLAALSPQISVEGNLKNALNVWAGWLDAGRPEDSAEILGVLRGTLRRTYGNTLKAWENNTVRALQGQGILSGPKVDSFMRNLLGDVEEVTNDAWMANYSLVNQTIFKGGLNVRGTDPGKGTGYLAMNARIRETAREMTRLTGETWSPAEVQETIWSWAKTITEMADSATEVRSAEELVLDRAVTDELIASTPDFGTLFTMPEYRQILEEAGYGEQISGIDSERDAARQARQEPAARSEAWPFAEEAQLKLERQAARRIDQLRKQRIEASRVEEDGEVPFSRRSPGKYDALPGAPKVRGATGPDPKLVAVAERYAADNGIDLRRQAEYVKADPERGARIAAAYEAMKHEPQSTRVRRAYASLIEQTRAQYDALEEAGYRFYFTDPAADPYSGNPWDAMRDLRENSRMGVFPTDAGFGSGATDIDVRDNPLMADTGLRWPFGSERGELRPVLANDLFRAVHDAFGHGLEGAGFRADGEENAWQAHVRLFTGDAIGAITTETRGQNSWLNFGPYGESNRTAKVEDTVFADQKTGLMPEWTWTEGRAGDMPVASRRAATLNIGLSTKELRGGGELTEAEVLSAVKASGVKVLKATRQVSDSEPTLVIDIDRKLTKDEGDRISAALDQEAIVQRHDSGVGELFGPMAEKWSPYNPAWFVMHDGGRASDSPIASRRQIDLFPNEGATKRTKSSVRRVVDTSGRSVARGNVNSRGKAISPIKQGLDNFWRWFGDSVAVDEKERPLVLFHATTGDFDTFETGRKTKNSYGILGDHEVTRSGIFLTPEISAAEEYVEGKSGASVMQLYAKLEDPLDLSSGGLSESDYQRMLSSGVNPRVVTRAQSYWEMFDNEDDGSNSFVDGLREAGYDGAIFYELTNDRRDALTYVVFDPGQVKSVTGNTGTFSSGSKSIIASRRATGFSAKPRQPDAVSADAYHYSNTPGLTALDTSYAGTAGAGRERRRFGMDRFGKQGGTAARLGFYVREPGAEIPGAESAVRDAGGRHLYRVQLSNLYDLATDPRGYADEAGANQDYLEELVADGGFDGFLAGPQSGIDTPVAVVFDIGKNKIPVEAVEDDGVVASRRSGDPFYSAALRAIEAGNGAPKRGTAEQWRGWLDGAVRRGEMKQSERDWLGIDDWIAKQGGAVTREQLADFIRANEVRVEEVTLGEGVDSSLPAGWTVVENEDGDGFELLDEQGIMRGEGETRAEAIADGQDRDERGEAGAPKFSAYQLPGGSNYRELLLTLPPKAGRSVDEIEREWNNMPVSDPRWQALADERQAAIKASMPSGKFKSSHFDQPNILAHVRFNERTDADGKRVLFIEEIQSDWHQQGRKQGYAKPQQAASALTAEQSARRDELLSSGRLTDAEAAELGALNRQRQAAQQGTPIAASSGVPDAPFKATDEWAMLAFKRMVRHAAENGFDRIAWTTGEQQAERYDLSKQVSQIRVIPGAANSSVPVGTRRVIITKSDGTDIDLKVGGDGSVSAGPFNAGFNGKSLDDVVGKEIAERIMAAEKETALRGDGLKVGGEGMKGFYDKILPSAVNKWAKKFGAKVRAARLAKFDDTKPPSAMTDAELVDALSEPIGGHEVHAIDLTPQMRDAALEGQPLFSRRTPQQAQAERGSLFGRLAADGYAMGNATQPQPGGRFVSLQRAADGLRVKLQDKMLPALRVQERATAGGASQAGVSTLTLDDMQNAYRMENLRHGATKEGVDKLNDEHVMPIQRALRDAGFSLAMFEDYLYALAAPERNASIAQINRGMPDAGSGIATQQARDILAGRAPGVYSGKVLTPDALRLFKSLEPHVRAIRNIALDSAVEAGQLPAQLARALRQKYPNYVPMRGKDDVLDQARPAAGRGLSQARSGMKRALGRGQDNIPQNVLGELIGDAQRGIAAREQSKATKAFLRFALANPMPELFEVEPVDLEWKFSESTGEAYLGVKGRAEDVDSKMIVMQDGKPVYVKFHDEGLRDAILNMGAEDFAGFTKWAGWLNRWRSAVLTRFNPAFPPVNIMRDILFGGVAVVAEHGAAALARAASIYPRAMAAAWAHTRGRRGDASVPDAQKTIADWVQEFYETGGSTGLTMTEKPADLQRKLEMASVATSELMKLAASGRPLAASAEAISRAGKPIIDLIESANEASENALRIATYIEQRQRGVSKFKAAEYAKNVTINFNRKGQYGPVLNALFLFYNAAMQGTHAVVRVMRNPKAMAFLAGMGALQAMLAASMMGDDDDDGITRWDTVPDYVKRTSLVIPVGDDRYFAIPMPYGFNLTTYAAGRATQHAYSGRRPTDSNVALDILKSAVEAFSPIPIQDGYSALFGDQLAFVMRLGANRDDFGGKLTNTDDYSDYPVPLALQGKATTPRVYHSTAQLLAKLGGGDLAEKIPPVGYLDVSPEQLEAVTSYFGGGITSLLNKSMTWGEQMQAGNLRGVSDVVAATPIASRFYGKPSDARAIAARYYGERGEFARHRAIVNERVATGMSLEEAKADRPKEYVKGLDQGTYKRSGKRKDGSRYRAGEKRPGIQETEGTPAHTAKDVRKRVSDIGDLIAGVREGMTNAELAAAYSAQHRIAKQTVGSNFMPEGMTGKPADLGLPAGFAERVPAPARVKNRAIKLLQDLRAAEEQRLLRALQFQRRLDSVKVPAQQKPDQAKLDRDFEAMFGGDNFDPEAISP